MIARLLAVIGLSCLFGCGIPIWTPRPVELPDGPEPADLAAPNAVYSVVIDSMGRLFHGSPFLVVDSTDQSALLDAGPHQDGFSDITYPAAGAARARRALAPQFHARVPVQLVPEGTTLPGHPGAAGVAYFSDVFFNPDSTHAYVGATFVCGGLCGVGVDYYLARKPRRAWAVVKIVELWRS